MRKVMITGAGGSIGSELCRQVSPNADMLVLFDSSEYALYRIEQELRLSFPDLYMVAVLGDVRDDARVGYIVSWFKPDTVIHAAAYKHVPMAEDINAWEVVRTNALGTYVVATAAADVGVNRFVLISTDKAVRPVNVMGGSKRLAELVLQSLDTTMSCVTVRFGNVIDSAGSVVPRFREQIAVGGPVTVTHPEVTRYMMSIEQAVKLVLMAARNGTHGQILTLDMGKPIAIVDLARDMIRKAASAAPIRFTGLRPGEKLHEELIGDMIVKTDAEWLRNVLDWLTWTEPANVRQELMEWLI